MREIGFRVWDKQTKSYDSHSEFVLSSSGELMELCSRHNGTWEYHFADTDRFIIEFDTGLKDKNGKEIYEGDILTIWIEHYKQIPPYLVEDMRELYYECNRDDSYYRVNDTEVIGNVHENKDLLKGEK